MQGREEALEERYAYYRRCQVFRKGGQQCKAPAMKGQEVCHKHEAKADMERRRAAMWERLALPPLVDFKSVQRAIARVAQALAEDSIDDKTASEALHRLQNAGVALRRLGRV